ncbi:ACDE family multidrug resistance protein [Paenibacillus methanolicus]|uniref:ACDE family multidrug resistance protein n=2 Tax=Paenibacillus methanolicus TaxID=582686 RepID=A0A5S5C5A0_9BACL|nr:MFS transporter [Paenibacillus methanolicus]TYP73788.1 ACDE family multidrug resistance protein [Paenibacillus methanolicus]
MGNTTTRAGGRNHKQMRTYEPAKDKKNGAKSSGTGGAKWKEYIAFASVPLVLVLGNSMLVPILPDLQQQLGVTDFQSSLVITLFSVAAGVIIPIMGYLSDRYSRKIIILVSLAIYGAAGIVAGLGALWHSYGVLITARAFQGIGAAGTSPIAMALVGDMYKDGEESEALGLIEASNGTGKVVSPIIGSLLAMWMWYAPLFAFPFFCAASFALMLMIKEPKKTDKKPMPVKTYVANVVQVFREKGKWLISSFLAGALGLFILFGVLFRLSDVLEKKPYSIDGVAKGGILAIPLLGLVITAYMTGHHIKNNGVLMRRLMMLGLAILAASLGAAAFFHQNVWIVIGLATVGSVGTGMLLPCLNTLITGSVDSQHRGMITSLYSSLRFLGVAFGPPIFGWLAGKSDLLLYSVVAGLSLCALGLVAGFVRPPKTAGDAA